MSFVYNISYIGFSDMSTPSVGQCPWLIDLAWHLPFGRSMRFLEKAAAEMMRTRMKRSNETEMLDLSSYLVNSCQLSFIFFSLKQCSSSSRAVKSH